MDIAVWKMLASEASARLRTDAASTDAQNPSRVRRLRSSHPWAGPELIHAALQLARARSKARAKFGAACAAGLLADVDGVEMASGSAVASHKAVRFAACFPGALVADLCCGIGGDAIALAAAGTRVAAIDRDATRAWMAASNASRVGVCEGLCAGVEEVLAGGSGLVADARCFHIDPARRGPQVKSGATGRSRSLDGLAPGVEVLRGVVERFGHGAVKLAPGVDFDAAHGAIAPGEFEVISESGTLTQAVLWTGLFAGRTANGAAMRRATLLDNTGESHTLAGEPDDQCDPGTGASAVPVVENPEDPRAACGKYVFEIDDAPQRAGLLRVLCAHVRAPMLHPRVGLLTADHLLESTWLRAFEVVEVIAWNQRRVEGVLRGLGAGIVEVKTRGKVVEPDALQRALSDPRSGGDTFTLFVLRFGRSIFAIVARRVPRASLRGRGVCGLLDGDHGGGGLTGPAPDDPSHARAVRASGLHGPAVRR